MTILGAFCMAHSFVMAGEICSKRHTKDENQRWSTPPFAADRRPISRSDFDAVQAQPPIEPRRSSGRRSAGFGGHGGGFGEHRGGISFGALGGGGCDHRSFIRVTGFKPLLTIWVANAPVPSGEGADWHA